jgi:hypothetical protein
VHFAAGEVAPWWTAADDAEQLVLAFEFTKAAYAHRDRCAVCSEGGPWCDSLRSALDAVLEWREGRKLRSKAQWLRVRERAREDLVAAA